MSFQNYAVLWEWQSISNVEEEQGDTKTTRTKLAELSEYDDKLFQFIQLVGSKTM